jgi:hypothetical protein
MTDGVYLGAQQEAPVSTFYARCGTGNCKFSVYIDQDREEDARPIVEKLHKAYDSQCAERSSEFIEPAGSQR